jgi:hypothetical protein
VRLPHPPPELIEVFWDIVSNILYVGGILFIEKVLRPFFGGGGTPFFVNVILIIGDITFAISLLTKLTTKARLFIKELKKTFKEVRA